MVGVHPESSHCISSLTNCETNGSAEDEAGGTTGSGGSGGAAGGSGGTPGGSGGSGSYPAGYELRSESWLFKIDILIYNRLL